VGQDSTANGGRYVVNLRNRSGMYRARVLASSLSGGDSCEAATSDRDRYRRN
jgi:hypothetical protein